MQDLLGTNLTYNKSKKDDASSPDDSIDEPVTGPRPCSNSPIAEDDNGISSPELVMGNGAAAANGAHDQLVLASTGQPLLRIPAVGIMFADTLYGAPAILPELVNRWGVVHKVLIILTIRQVLFGSVFVSDVCLALSECFAHTAYWHCWTYDVSLCMSCLSPFMYTSHSVRVFISGHTLELSNLRLMLWCSCVGGSSSTSLVQEARLQQ